MKKNATKIFYILVCNFNPEVLVNFIQSTLASTDLHIYYTYHVYADYTLFSNLFPN